jgi:uncharacterized protein YabE (DUF348 family)
MPGTTSKCKNKFCQEKGAQYRPSDKIKVAEMLNVSATLDIRLCMECQHLFDMKRE